MVKTDIILQKIISILFLGLIFFLPLIFWIPNSEVFELPKMYFVYAMTTLISGLWLARMVVRREIVVKRTPLDIPVLLFLISQIASTIYSIDPHISWFGWYGRFNGGLLATVSYTLLYYALTSNISEHSENSESRRVRKSDNQKARVSGSLNLLFSEFSGARSFLSVLIFVILASALIVSGYAFLQHFGIDREFWVQDVMNRVFSTQGQPNWLAGYIVMTMPLAFVITSSKFKVQSSKFFSYGIIIILFLALLWTKSRSGLVGFAVADVVFWLTAFAKKESGVKSRLKRFLLIHIVVFLIILSTDNPARNFLFGRFRNSSISSSAPYSILLTPAPTKSEHGGTESGDIRRLVWLGALKIAKQNPVFGTGPETFGLTYWQVRAKEANLTSEWNFLYNKAHNEWLNLAANTGMFGLGTHLLLLGWFTIWSVNQLKIRNPKSEIRNNDQNSKFKNSKLNPHGFDNSDFEFVSNFDIRASDLTIAAILAAIVGVETINFFGFSTVTTEAYRYLFMGIAVMIVSREQRTENRERKKYLPLAVYCLLFTIFLATFYFTTKISRLFRADLKYNLGRQFYSAGIIGEAINPLYQAVDLAPGEPVFRNELAETLSAAAISIWTDGDKNQAVKVKNEATANFKIVSSQSKFNLTFLRTQAQMEFLMRKIDPSLTDESLELAQKAIDLSPTDPRGYYLLGRMHEELGEKTKAQDLYRRAIELKPDYEEAKRLY